MTDQLLYTKEAWLEAKEDWLTNKKLVKEEALQLKARYEQAKKLNDFLLKHQDVFVQLSLLLGDMPSVAYLRNGFFEGNLVRADFHVRGQSQLLNRVYNPITGQFVWLEYEDQDEA